MATMVGSLRRTGLFPILIAILAALLLIQTIRLTWLIVTPLGPVGDWRADEVQVLSPQSRLALFSSFDPFFRNASAESGSVVTSLQLTLYGIRMNSGSGLGSAILAGTDGVQESYAVDDEIMAGVKLAKVRFDHVVIDRGGVMESLYMDQSVPAETVDPRKLGEPLTGPENSFEQPPAQPDRIAADTNGENASRTGTSSTSQEKDKAP